MKIGSLSAMRSKRKGLIYPTGIATTLDAQAASIMSARTGPKLWIDPSVASTRFQDTAAATSLTTAGQTFGRINDRSGSGVAFIQATAGKRPSYVTASGLSWISADGTDDGLYTSAAFDLSTVNKVTLIVGLRKRDSVATVMIAEHGPDFTVGGAFGLYSSQGSQAYYQWGASGATNNPTPIIAAPQPTDVAVVTGTVDLSVTSGTSMMVRRNGVLQNDASVPGNRNFKSDVLNILCRNQASLFAPFDIASLIVVGGTFFSANDLNTLEQMTAAKCGISF